MLSEQTGKVLLKGAASEIRVGLNIIKEILSGEADGDELDFNVLEKAIISSGELIRLARPIYDARSKEKRALKKAQETRVLFEREETL